MISKCKRLIFVCLFTILIAALTLDSCDKLPEKVLVSEIPDYYFEHNYLDKCVNNIKEAIGECSGDYEMFFWITDMHWEPDLNTRRSPSLIKYINEQIGINIILNGGDTANSQILCKNAIGQLVQAIGSDRVYTVTGNHEINDASRYECPFQRVADELRGHNTDIIYGDGDKSYFYFDDTEKKTRYVGLSSYRLYLNNKYESGYDYKQLSWLKSVALNTEKGWSIIIFTHSLYVVDTDDTLVPSPYGADNFIDAIDNYKGDGTIVCVLMGHSHRDRIHIGRTGVPYIVSACDRFASYKGDINVDRVPGAISEQHFEVVIIDKEKRKIKFYSIGSNARDGIDDDPGKPVDVRIVKY